MNLNKISVITVVYNSKAFIEDTISSVINQSYKNIEYIIIDGGSTDGTIEIIKKYKNHISYLISEPDNGIFDAMNKGLMKATGEFIIFMNAGDTFVDKSIIQLVFNRDITTKTGVVFGDVYSKYKSKLQREHYTPFYLNKKRIRPMGISHQSIFVKTTLAQSIGFSAQFKVAADYDLINQIYKKEYEFLDVGFPISIYDTTGFSAKNRKLAFKEVGIICNVEKTVLFKLSYLLLSSKLFVKKILHFILLKS